MTRAKARKSIKGKHTQGKRTKGKQLFGPLPWFAWVFIALAIAGREFITSRSMKGSFDDTVIIMMGCSGIFWHDMARAFIEKGASVYIAWTGSVLLDYVDRATPYLLEQLCSQNLTIRQAIDSTMDVIGADPTYEAWLKYYPARSGDKTVAELLQMAFDGEDETGAEIE